MDKRNRKDAKRRPTKKTPPPTGAVNDTVNGNTFDGILEMRVGDSVILGGKVVAVRGILNGDVQIEISDGFPTDGVNLDPH